MTLSIKNNGYVFLLRLDLMFSISLFRTILSFCSVFTRDFSCAMSWKYEQCWQLQQPIITEKLTGPKKKTFAEKWCSDDIALAFILCNVVWSLLDNIAQGFYLYNVVPRVLRHHWTRFLPVHCYLEPLGQHCSVFTFVMLAHG